MKLFKKTLLILLLICIIGTVYAGDTSQHSNMPNDDLDNVNVKIVSDDYEYGVVLNNYSTGHGTILVGILILLLFTCMVYSIGNDRRKRK